MMGHCSRCGRLDRQVIVKVCEACLRASSCTGQSRCSLPDWSDRITFRSGADEEIILRVPVRDGDGQCRAVNHILTMRHARELAVELAEALLDRTVKQRERMDAANNSISQNSKA